jgi:hypothetical protein
MAECIDCGGYTKYKNGRCYKCYNKHKGNNSINTSRPKGHNRKRPTNRTYKPKGNSIKKLPSHTELYKDLHKIKDGLLRYIFWVYEWDFEKDGLFGTKKTKYDIKLEYNNWDIVYFIKGTPHKPLQKDINRFGHYALELEYKSTIEEWGKKIDDYMRQLRKRKHKNGETSIILTFDEEFRQYEQAFAMADVQLIILPDFFLQLFRGEHGDMNSDEFSEVLKKIIIHSDSEEKK